MFYTLFFLIILSNQISSLKLDQNYQVGSWENSRKLCVLAGKSDICNSSSSFCEINVSEDDVSNIFSYPLWINGFVSRPPWVVQVGCTEVTEYLFPAHSTGVFKLDANQTINECVSLCGNSSSYGISGLLCYCLLDLPRTKSNLSNCHTSCHINYTEPCKTETDNSGIIYITEYKQLTGALMKNVSQSPWDSCASASKTLNVAQIEDCRRKIPFICVNESGFEIHSTFLTWYAANQHCKNEGMMLINRIPFGDDINSLLSNDTHFWTSITRPLQWTWDVKDDLLAYDLIDCLVLNKDENGIVIQTRNCSFAGITGLCVSVETGNRTLNFSQINVREGDNKNTEENNMSAAYIGIGIGAMVLCIAAIAGVVLARRRFMTQKNSHLLPVNNEKNTKLETGNDDSIPLDDKGYVLNSFKDVDVSGDKYSVAHADSEVVNDRMQGQSSEVSDTTKVVDAVIETVPEKQKSKKSKSTSKKKKPREIEISIEDESVTIVDDGSYDTQLSQTV